MPSLLAAITSSNQQARADTGAMFPIFAATVTTTAASITFSNIPSTYKHLHLRGLFGSVSGDDAFGIQFNGDTGNNYAYHYLASNGTTTYPGSSTSRPFAILTDSAGAAISSRPSTFVMDILEYTSTTKTKVLKHSVGTNNNGPGWQQFVSGLWFATPAAITSITLLGLSGARFSQYSSIALYGIKGA